MSSNYDVLLAPVMTEKSMSRNGVYTFLVAKKANKMDIQKSVEEIFNVKIASVNVLNRKGKSKWFRGEGGQHADRKFAIVRLSEGSINYEGGI